MGQIKTAISIDVFFLNCFSVNCKKNTYEKVYYTAFYIFNLFEHKCNPPYGGRAYVQNDQPGDYEILLTLYRDTLGIPMQTTQNIEIYNSSGSVVTTISCNLDLNAFHPVFGLQNGSVLPFFPYGVEVYFFTAVFNVLSW